MIGEVQSLSQGIEGEIWMQIDKPTFIHILILKEKELKNTLYFNIQFCAIYIYIYIFFYHIELARMFMA